MINILEIIMVISTLMYSYLILYCRRSSFVFGLIAAGITSYILTLNGIYIQAILNLLYGLIYVYSFFVWKREKDFKIYNISIRGIILSVTYILVFTIGIGYSFSRLGTEYPFLDAFSSACSITAIFLLSRKIIENSYLFILSNVTSIMILYMTGDYIAVLAFLIYMLFNIIRIFTWNKIRKNEL